MRYTLTLLFVFLCSLAVCSQSYRNSGNYNRIGVQAKYALIDVETSDFDIEGEGGFMGGFTTRGRFYNNFGIVYGIDFLSSKVMIKGRPLGQVTEEQMEYNIIGAQLNLLLSYNIIGQHLAIDFGPALLVNSKMELKNNGQETNIVSGYTSLTAEDIEDISRINPFGVIAITGGFESVRFTVQYQYGFTNFFNSLNDQDLINVDLNAVNFDGTASFIAAGIVLYL